MTYWRVHWQEDAYGLFFLSKALFSLQNFWFLATVALSFLFDKYCPIME